jgi:hypothetical protein
MLSSLLFTTLLQDDHPEYFSSINYYVEDIPHVNLKIITILGILRHPEICVLYSSVLPSCIRPEMPGKYTRLRNKTITPQEYRGMQATKEEEVQGNCVPLPVHEVLSHTPFSPGCRRPQKKMGCRGTQFPCRCARCPRILPFPQAAAGGARKILNSYQQ